MKRLFLPAVILITAFWGTVIAQETNPSEKEGTTPETVNTVADADNLGMALLDQAIEAKLRATSVLHLSQVIDLCQRANTMGLTGENLRYCNQLLTSAQLERGLFLAEQLLSPPNARPSDWRTIRQRTLSDLEAAVSIIKDQPAAYLRIAQLNLMPDGDQERAKETLKLAIQSSKDEPAVQILAAQLFTEVEPDASKREEVVSIAAKNGNPQIMMLHVFTLLELDRREEATNVLRQWLEIEGDDAEILGRIVLALTEEGEHELAINVLDAMRAKANDDRKIRIDMMKADMLNTMDRYEDALALLNALSEQNRENDEITFLVSLLRSNTHLAMGNFDEALKDVEAAEQERPDFPPIWEQKYRIFLEQEKYTDALAAAKRLQTLAESPLNVLWEIHALTELKRYDEAIEGVKTLREKYPNTEQWVSVLVDIYSKQKDFDKALAVVEEQLAKSPEELRWILVKTGVYTEQKKWDEAITWLESHLQKTPDSIILNLSLLEVLYDKKSYREAKERLRQMLEKEPDNLTLLRFDSQLSISLGLHGEAVEALSKVIESDPRDSTSLNNLAWLMATSPQDAIRDGNRAVELAEKAGELTRHKEAFVLSTLAAAYAEAGNFEKAREWSRASVEVAKKERGKTAEKRKELLENLQKEWECFSQDKPFREQLSEEE